MRAATIGALYGLLQEGCHVTCYSVQDEGAHSSIAAVDGVWVYRRHNANGGVTSSHPSAATTTNGRGLVGGYCYGTLNNTKLGIIHGRQARHYTLYGTAVYSNPWYWTNGPEGQGLHSLSSPRRWQLTPTIRSRPESMHACQIGRCKGEVDEEEVIASTNFNKYTVQVYCQHAVLRQRARATMGILLI